MAVFNAYEIFEIAEQIERNGYKFYKTAADMIEDKAGKVFMNHMADMELDHEDTFGKIKEKFSLKGDQEFPDIDNQTLAYLQAVASGNVFVASNTQKEIIKGNESVMDLIRLALCFEKDSIVYFSTVKEVLVDEEDKKMVDALIKEELGHVSLLVEKMEALK